MQIQILLYTRQLMDAFGTLPKLQTAGQRLAQHQTIDWYAIDFGQPHEISNIKLYLFADNKTFAVPDKVTIEYKNGDQWLPVNLKNQNAGKLIGNTVNTIAFNKISATNIRINFKHKFKQVAVSEVECY